MLELKLSKSLMENEEGLNFLWICLVPQEPMVDKFAKVQIQLSNGLYREKNLNGYFDYDNTIVIEPLQKKNEIIIELFTREPIECHLVTINISVNYDSEVYDEKYVIQIPVVTDDDMELVTIDQEIVNMVCNLKKEVQNSEHLEDCISISIKNMTMVTNQISDLEKRYRINY